MKGLLESKDALDQVSAAVGGVFTRSDLAHVMGVVTPSTLNARIKRLLKAGTLLKVRNGLYCRPDASLTAVAARAFPDGYVSLTAALVRHRLIGTNPSRVVDVLAPRARPRTIQFARGEIRLRVQKACYGFGFERVEGIPWALPEKAWVDTCYYYLKGERFPFALEDVWLSALNWEKVNGILEAYQNPKFRTFVMAMGNNT